MASLTPKFVTTTWNRTSSTGKSLAKLLTAYEKANKALEREESRETFAAVTGALNAVHLAARKAVADYVTKGDAKMRGHSEDLVELAQERRESVQKRQWAYLGRISTWVDQREELIRELEGARPAFHHAVRDAHQLLDGLRDLQAQSLQVVAHADLAAAMIITGKSTTAEENIERVLKSTEGIYDELKNAISPIRMQRPESKGIDLAKDDVAPHAGLWIRITDLQSEFGELLKQVEDAHLESLTLVEMVKAAFTKGEGRAQAFAGSLGKVADDAEKVLVGLQSSAMSKWEGDLRILDDYARVSIPDAIRAKSKEDLQAVVKGCKLRLDSTDRRDKTVQDRTSKVVGAIDAALRRVPKDVTEGPTLGPILQRLAKARERAIDMGEESKLRLADTKKRLKELQPILANAREALGVG